MSEQARRSAAPRSAPVEAGFLALALVFVGFGASLLPSLQHLVDEGTNVYAARLIQQGQVPFRDFFYHQPPLHLALLALLPTDHIVWGRAASLLATALSGRVLFEIARGLFPVASPAALLPVALFYFAALQAYGSMALPNAWMLLFALLAAWLTLDRERVVGGAAAMVVAVLFKPIAIPLIFALLLALASVPARRREVVPLAATIGAGALLSYAVLHLTSDGAFSDLVRLQAARYADETLLDILKGLPLLRDALLPWSSPVLNVLYHRHWVTSADLVLVLLALPGIWLFVRGNRVGRGAALLWPCWWLFSVLGVIYLWDVSWDHYHVLYLPPLALFGGFALAALARRGLPGRIATVGLCVAFGVANLVTTWQKRQDYAPVLALRGTEAPLLTFDTTLNVLSATESPCGLLDYLAQRSPAFLGEPFARFRATSADIVRCLEAEPTILVVVHQLSNTGLLFFDAELFEAVRALPPERVLYLGEGSREAFDALAEVL